VLDYTQTRQLKLLKDIGFDAPSWEDLIYLLCAIVVAASLLGAAWSAWERQRQDPWLRLLQQARQQLQRAGFALPAHSTPRQLAELLEGSGNDSPESKASQDWLRRLEALRYDTTAAPQRGQLTTLRRQLRQLNWPRSTPTP